MLKYYLNQVFQKKQGGDGDVKKDYLNKKYYLNGIGVLFTCILIFLLVGIPLPSFALENTTNQTNGSWEEELTDQQKSFGISSFIENAEEYSGEFFEGIDLQDLLNSAIKGEIDNDSLMQKAFGLLGNEVQIGIKSLISILVIIVIHSILKSVSENLENDTIAKLIFYVQYIAIVTVIMSNFSDIITMVKDTAGNLVGFMNCLVPLLVSLMLYTGSITTSGVLEPIILFMINLIGNLMENILIPLTLLIAAFTIVSKISDQIHIDKISKFLKSRSCLVFGYSLNHFRRSDFIRRNTI